MLDTRAVESKPGKAKKSFSANIFSLLIYHAHISCSYLGRLAVERLSQRLFFFRSLLYRRYLPPGGKSQVGTRDAKPLCKTSKVGLKGGSRRRPRDVCGRLCATRCAHEQHHARLYRGHGCRRVLRRTDTCGEQRRPCVPAVWRLLSFSRAPVEQQSVGALKLVTRRRDKWLS